MWVVAVQRAHVSACVFPAAYHHPNAHHVCCVGARWNRPAEGLAEGGGALEHVNEVSPLRYIPEKTTHKGGAGRRAGLFGRTDRAMTLSIGTVVGMKGAVAPN